MNDKPMDEDYWASVIEPDELQDINVRWIGKDKVSVQVDRSIPHWSELPEPVAMEVPSWDFGDNNKRDPENNWEEVNEL